MAETKETRTTTTTLVTAFEPQHGESKKTGKPWTRSDFKDANELKFSTFRGDVASVARALLNQPVVIEYEESQTTNNGQTYTNRTLLSVSAAGPGAIQGEEIVVFGPSDFKSHLAPSQKDIQIARAVATKLSYEVFAGIGQDPLLCRDEILQHAESLIPFLLTGQDTGNPVVTEA